MPNPDLPPVEGTPIDELLAGHALGDLDEAEQALLRRHLAADPGLHERLEELATTLQLLPLALPDQPMPPARLRSRVLDPRVAEAREERRFGPSWGRLPWGRLAMAGLAGGLVLTTVQLQQLRTQLAQQRQPAPAVSLPPASHDNLQVRRTLPLQGVTPNGTVSGQVVVQTAQGYNLLRLQGLPQPPPQHVYRLWAELDGREVGCVQFVPDDMGVVSMPIPTEPSSHAQRLSISLEPLRPGGEQPRGPRVVTSL